MSFYNLSYVVFLGLIWCLARTIRVPKARVFVLLAASYYFYFLLSPQYLTLLAFSSLANHLWGKLLRRRPTASLLWTGLALNIGILAISKYSTVLTRFWEATGWTQTEELLIPIGVSFYTFQAIGYLIDIYRGSEEQPRWSEFFLFMSFWPVILSGPICRVPEIIPQLRKQQSRSSDDFSEGFRRIVIGLFMKVVIADTLASGLQPGHGVVFGFDEIRDGWNSLDVWVLCLGYGFQIFFDFAGYSHIAIGTAKLFGIRLRENFRVPYGSLTLADFWSRWHMSLSSWIRDYLFFPLATKRRSLWWRNLSLVVSMTVFGMWHGVGATFVIWGLYHGLLLVARRLFQDVRKAIPALRKIPLWLDNGASWTLTFVLVTLGWILFRSNDWTQATRMFESLIHPGAAAVLPEDFYWLVAVVAASYLSWLGLRAVVGTVREGSTLAQLEWLTRPLSLFTMILMIIIWSDQSSPFVYVKF